MSEKTTFGEFPLRVYVALFLIYISPAFLFLPFGLMANFFTFNEFIGLAKHPLFLLYFQNSHMVVQDEPDDNDDVE